VRITCSDVLSKYVGESEQKIAQIFREAKANRQMLLLDEVDSLLSSRAQSTMLHERQMVNELLVQIECFDQPLFAATNFETSLDTAVLRRFDFKLECGYLEFVQARALLKQVLGITSLNKEEEKQLQTLKYLTPGDFAIAARRKKYSVTNLSTQSAIAILAEENARKQPKRTIGFN
jgi:SpoVK/Ycf46/Vps4 family AAA+-type ATPase